MVQLLLIAAFVLIHVHDAMGGGEDVGEGVESASTVVGGMALIWAAVQCVTVVSGRRLDRRGDYRAVRVAERAVMTGRIAATAWYAFSIFQLGWRDQVQDWLGDLVLADELVTAAPLLVFFAAVWWSMYPIERRLKDAVLWRDLHDGAPIHAPPTRAQYVGYSIRHQAMMILIPICLMSAWSESVPRLQGALKSAAPGFAAAFLPLAEWVGILAVLTISPAIIRHTWSTIEVGPGRLRDEANAMCRRYGVRVKGPLLWRTHGSLINAAILGVFWPFRYMLFTDALLDHLSAEQVQAVMAHEVAHVRRRHLIWLAVCVFAGVFVVFWAVAGVAFVSRVPADEDTLSTVASILALLGAGMVFGLVSRRFEWQADAFAVQHLSATLPEEEAAAQGSPRAGGERITRQAVGVMTSALQSVAELNGISPSRFSWRHGSIAQRQRRLVRLVDTAADAAPIDRQVRYIKIAGGIALLLSVAPMVLEAAMEFADRQ